MAVLTKHFNLTPSETIRHFKFHGRVRKPGETVAMFAAELHSLAEFCNFGESLDEMLIIQGINDNRSKRG